MSHNWATISTKCLHSLLIRFLLGLFFLSQEFRGKRIQVAWSEDALKKKPSRFREYLSRLQRYVAEMQLFKRKTAGQNVARVSKSDAACGLSSMDACSEQELGVKST